MLNTMKARVKQVMLKPPQELMAIAFTCRWELVELTMGFGSSSSKIDGLSGMLLISSWSLYVLWSGI